MLGAAGVLLASCWHRCVVSLMVLMVLMVWILADADQSWSMPLLPFTAAAVRADGPGAAAPAALPGLSVAFGYHVADVGSVDG